MSGEKTTIRTHLTVLGNVLRRMDEGDVSVELIATARFHQTRSLALMDKALLHPSCMIGWVRLVPDPPVDPDVQATAMRDRDLAENAVDGRTHWMVPGPEAGAS